MLHKFISSCKPYNNPIHYGYYGPHFIEAQSGCREISPRSFKCLTLKIDTVTDFHAFMRYFLDGYTSDHLYKVFFNLFHILGYFCIFCT